MRVLLDTHVFVWAITTPRRLSGATRSLLEDPATSVLVSSASAWEIATKHRIGRWPEAAAVLGDYQGHLETFLAEDLAVTSRHALAAGAFAQAHGDPFDRLLAAQALLEGVPLSKAKIAGSGPSAQRDGRRALPSSRRPRRGRRGARRRVAAQDGGWTR